MNINNGKHEEDKRELTKVSLSAKIELIASSVCELSNNAKGAGFKRLKTDLSEVESKLTDIIKELSTKKQNERQVSIVEDAVLESDGDYQALLKLRPKFQTVVKRLDSMSDEEWWDWQGNLPEDEFIAFISLRGDQYKPLVDGVYPECNYH